MISREWLEAEVRNADAQALTALAEVDRAWWAGRRDGMRDALAQGVPYRSASTRWWRCTLPDGRVWIESSNETEVREAFAEVGGKLWTMREFSGSEWEQVE